MRILNDRRADDISHNDMFAMLYTYAYIYYFDIGVNDVRVG